MARLYLIRHGKPASTWWAGDGDPGLDGQGVDQANAVRDWLLALPQGERPLRVVSSPLRRCRETAEPTAAALGVVVEIDPAVGEIPTPSGLADAKRQAWLRKAFAGTWDTIEGDLDYGAWRGIVAGALKSRGDTAVFSHYVAINAVVSLLRNDERVQGVRPDHASVTVLDTDGETLSLITLGREAASGVL